MKKPILFILLSLVSLYSLAQFNIDGKVVDADTREPLTGASVFAQNTTRGTITDKDGLFHLYLDKGGYELIISFTGYTSQTITIQKAPDSTMIIEMKKADNSMSEVVVKSSYEVENGWELYGDFFMKHFIGSTPFSDSCSLENPDALRFLYYKRNDRLKVLASEPLIISNRALGYNLRYELDSFVYFFKNDLNSYRGSCLYSQMDGTPEEKAIWKTNRENAYFGSRLHFLRAYFDSTLKQEGFTVDVQSKNTPGKFARLVNPYDTAYYFYNDTTNEAELWFPVKASITFNKKAPDPSYLAQYKLPLNVNVQISYIDLLDGIVIQPNGYFFSQRSWINQGYWSWKNLADQLPYDYEPDR